jgi:hypothetical protein
VDATVKNLRPILGTYHIVYITKRNKTSKIIIINQITTMDLLGNIGMEDQLTSGKQGLTQIECVFPCI